MPYLILIGCELIVQPGSSVWIRGTDRQHWPANVLVVDVPRKRLTVQWLELVKRARKGECPRSVRRTAGLDVVDVDTIDDLLIVYEHSDFCKHKKAWCWGVAGQASRGATVRGCSAQSTGISNWPHSGPTNRESISQYEVMCRIDNDTAAASHTCPSFPSSSNTVPGAFQGWLYTIMDENLGMGKLFNWPENSVPEGKGLRTDGSPPSGTVSAGPIIDRAEEGVPSGKKRKRRAVLRRSRNPHRRPKAGPTNDATQTGCIGMHRTPAPRSTGGVIIYSATVDTGQHDTKRLAADVKCEDQ